MIECFALWFICKPPFDKLVMTTTLPSNQVALSVFLTPLAKGTENLGATCYRLITQQERTPLWSSFDCFLHLILISVDDVAEPTTCLYRLKLSVESTNTPKSRNNQTLFGVLIIPYYIAIATYFFILPLF